MHLFNDKPITPVNELQFLCQTLLLLTLQAEHEVGFCCSELRIWDSSLAVTVQLNRIPLGTNEVLGVHVCNGIHVSVLAKTWFINCMPQWCVNILRWNGANASLSNRLTEEMEFCWDVQAVKFNHPIIWTTQQETLSWSILISLGCSVWKRIICAHNLDQNARNNCHDYHTLNKYWGNKHVSFSAL